MEIKWNNLHVPKRKSAVLSWNTSYAAFVHEGYTRGEGDIAPARPWVNQTIDEFDFVQELKHELASTDSIDSAFESMANSFGESCQENIELDIWNWDRTTVRSNGEVVSSPRNIIDTKELYNSYTIEHQD